MQLRRRPLSDNGPLFGFEALLFSFELIELGFQCFRGRTFAIALTMRSMLLWTALNLSRSSCSADHVLGAIAQMSRETASRTPRKGLASIDAP